MDDRELRPRRRDHSYSTRSQSGRTGTASSYQELPRAFQSRPSWYSEVEEAVYAQAYDSSTGLYECAISGTYGERDEMSIDHIQDWQTYCISQVDVTGDYATDRQAVRDAYNDMNNLQLVKRGVNSSKGNRRRAGRNYLQNSS